MTWGRDRQGPMKEALVISTALHLSLFLFSLFLQPPEPTILSFNIQLLESEKRIPQETKKEIQQALEKVEREKKQAEAKKKTAKEEASRPEDRAAGEPVRGEERLSEEERFARDFERTMYARDSSRTVPRPGGKSGQDTSWEKDAKSGNYGKTDKMKTGESVKVPEGKTGAGGTKWRSGYNRRMTYLPAIEYPLYYRQQGIQADVLLSIEVDPSGRVVEVDIIKSSGYPKLDIIAKNAVRQARFTVASGAVVNDIGEIEIRFTLH